jgi:hypothetical protein
VGGPATGSVCMLEEGMDQEVSQQVLQGGSKCSLDQKEVTVMAQPARGLVVGSVEERQPEATECEIWGVAARACVHGIVLQRLQ